MADRYQLQQLFSPVCSSSVHVRCKRRDQFVLCHRHLHRSLQWTHSHSSPFRISVGARLLHFEFSVNPTAPMSLYVDPSPSSDHQDSTMQCLQILDSPNRRRYPPAANFHTFLLHSLHRYISRNRTFLFTQISLSLLVFQSASSF